MLPTDPARPRVKFPGYGRPYFTEVPNLFLDQQMQDLSLAELRALLYIFRCTYGWHQETITLSQDDFVHGRRAADGSARDRGAGISKNSVSTALGSLVKAEFIFCHLQRDAQHGNRPNLYELNIAGYPQSCNEFCWACAPPPPSSWGEGAPQTWEEGVPKVWGEGPPSSWGEGAPKVWGELSIDERKTNKERDGVPFTEHIPQDDGTQPTRGGGTPDSAPEVRTDPGGHPAQSSPGETPISASAARADPPGIRSAPRTERALVVSVPASVQARPALHATSLQQGPLGEGLQSLKGYVGEQATPPPHRGQVEPTRPPHPLPALSAAAQDAQQLWQAAQPYLRVTLGDDYPRVLRYAVLLELDRAGGEALLGVPNPALRDQIAGRLAAPLAALFTQLCHAPIQVRAAVLAGHGPLAPPQPTLAALRAHTSPQEP